MSCLVTHEKLQTDSINSSISFTRAFFSPDKPFSGTPEQVEVCVQSRSNPQWCSTFTIPFSQISVSALKKACPFLSVSSKSSVHILNHALSESLAQGLVDGSVESGYYLAQSGATHFVDNVCRFLRGTELIGPPCEKPYSLVPQLQDMYLVGKGDLSPKQLALVLHTSPAQVFLTLAYILLTSVRSIIFSYGVNFQAILYMAGKQGVGKTTLARRMAGIYKRISDDEIVGFIQAGSTAAATNELLVLLRDQPIVVDDLCYSADKNVERKRRELGARLIRQGAGQEPILKKRGTVLERSQCNAGIILTAEFTLENMSDLTRCLIVPFEKQLSLSSDLTPELIGDTIRWFSEWISTNENTAIEDLLKKLKADDVFDLDPRVFTNYACLEWAFNMLLKCMRHHKVPEHNCIELNRKMQEAKTYSISIYKRLHQELLDRIPCGNIAWCILRGYKKDCFNLCDNLDELSKHDGIIWKSDLCLRPEALVSFIHDQPGYKEINKRRIVDELKRIRALVLQEDSADTVHLEKRKKGNSVPRVYRIRLNVLDKHAEKY